MVDDEDERRNLSPDSSTQLLHCEKRKHRKKKKHKHKSKKHKRKYSEDQEDSSYEKDSNYNSDNVCSGEKESQIAGMHGDNFMLDIKSLTAYIDNRKELNNELFTILEHKEIKKLLPQSIKKMSVDELKSRCLDQLEVISKKRLLKIIDGREMSCSSSESEHEEISQNDLVTKDSNNPNTVDQLNDTSMTEPQNESVNILEELSLVPDQEEIDELIEGANENAKKTDETEYSWDNGEALDTESQLVELEYRARALKSMVKAQQKLTMT